MGYYYFSSSSNSSYRCCNGNSTARWIFNLAQSHRVDLGGISGIGDVFRYTPDFSVLTDPRVYVFAITLAIVASLESLLMHGSN